MNSIFSMDNIFFRTVGKCTDLVWVNILTLVCCLPIFTIGASFTAMYTVLLKMVKNEEGGLTRTFFRAFRDNFKKATVVWLVCLVIGIVVASDVHLVRSGIMEGYGGLGKIVNVVVLLLALILFMIFTYIFPLMARYENSIKQTVINAAKLTLANFPRSLCMIVISVFPVALMMISDYFLWFWFLYGLAFPGFFNAQLLAKIFDKVEDVQNTGEK